MAHLRKVYFSIKVNNFSIDIFFFDQYSYSGCDKQLAHWGDRIFSFFSFIVLLFCELMTDKINVSDTVNFDDLTRVKGDKHAFTAFFILLFAYSI